MSIEHDNSGLETAEQRGEKIVDFVRGAEFGTPRYLAASDYFELQRLNYSLSIEHKNILDAKDDEKGRLTWESAARVSELKIALREHEISQRNYCLKDYGRAYLHMESSFADLSSAAWSEAEQKFPGDMDQQSRYEREIYDKADDAAEDAIWRKWDEEPLE